MNSIKEVVDKTAEYLADSDSCPSDDDESRKPKYEYYSRDGGGVLDSTGKYVTFLLM